MTNGRFRIRVFCAIFLATAAYQAAGRIGVFVSPDTVTVGDVITMDVVIDAPQNAHVTMPDVRRDFGDFTVLSHESVTAQGAEIDTVKHRYNLTTFKPQNCTIPSLKIFIGADDTVDTIYVEPIPIVVLSVIPSDADEGGIELRDLKKQQTTGRGSLWYLWTLAALALAALAYFLYKKYFKTRGADGTGVELKPPYEEAMDAIAALADKDYPAKGLVREYAFELSEIFKRYIDRRYDSGAVELTTEEIVEWFKETEISVDMRLCAERFLRDADRVKFAKWKPEPQTLNGFMSDVKLFLDTTKPEPPAEENETAEKDGAK